MIECEHCHRMKSEDDFAQVDPDGGNICRVCQLAIDCHTERQGYPDYDSILRWIYRDDEEGPA